MGNKQTAVYGADGSDAPTDAFPEKTPSTTTQGGTSATKSPKAAGGSVVPRRSRSPSPTSPPGGGQHGAAKRGPPGARRSNMLMPAGGKRGRRSSAMKRGSVFARAAGFFGRKVSAARVPDAGLGLGDPLGGMASMEELPEDARKDQTIIQLRYKLKKAQVEIDKYKKMARAADIEDLENYRSKRKDQTEYTQKKLDQAVRSVGASAGGGIKKDDFHNDLCNNHIKLEIEPVKIQYGREFAVNAPFPFSWANNVHNKFFACASDRKDVIRIKDVLGNPIVDFTVSPEVAMNDKIPMKKMTDVLGIAQKIEWDPTGRFLAVLPKGGGYVLLFDVDKMSAQCITPKAKARRKPAAGMKGGLLGSSRRNLLNSTSEKNKTATLKRLGTRLHLLGDHDEDDKPKKAPVVTFQWSRNEGDERMMGSRLLLGCRTGALIVYEVARSSQSPLEAGFQEEIHCCAWGPEGEIIVAPYSEAMIMMVDSQGETSFHEVAHTVRSITVSGPKDGWVASVLDENILLLLSLNDRAGDLDTYTIRKQKWQKRQHERHKRKWRKTHAEGEEPDEEPQIVRLSTLNKRKEECCFPARYGDIVSTEFYGDGYNTLLVAFSNGIIAAISTNPNPQLDMCGKEIHHYTLHDPFISKMVVNNDWINTSEGYVPRQNRLVCIGTNEAHTLSHVSVIDMGTRQWQCQDVMYLHPDNEGIPDDLFWSKDGELITVSTDKARVMTWLMLPDDARELEEKKRRAATEAKRSHLTDAELDLTIAKEQRRLRNDMEERARGQIDEKVQASAALEIRKALGRKGAGLGVSGELQHAAVDFGQARTGGQLAGLGDVSAALSRSPRSSGGLSPGRRPPSSGRPGSGGGGRPAMRRVQSHRHDASDQAPPMRRVQSHHGHGDGDHAKGRAQRTILQGPGPKVADELEDLLSGRLSISAM